jgi:peroxiredoxin
MKAWGETLDPAADLTRTEETPSANTGVSCSNITHSRSCAHGCLLPQIRFFADPTGRFTKMLDMAFDGSAIFGGDRSKRYAIVVEQGRVTSVNVEPDNTGTSVSLAEHVLGPASS